MTTKQKTQTQTHARKGFSMRQFLLAAAAAFALGGAVSGCTEPLTHINEVQPHYLTKSDFNGDWYFKQTVTQTSPLVLTGFQGWEGGAEKIRWEISQDFLTGYRIHEAVPGLDQDRTLEGGVYRGDPVVKFPVITHFDIITNYNAQTGEAGNRVIENTTDRPWYEREYFRVDWTANLVDSTAELPLMRWASQDTDYIREHEIYDPDHLRIEQDYMQVTLQGMFASSLANCYYTHGSFDCGVGEARLRYSFVRIGEEAERYQPVAYDDLVFLEDDDGKPIRTTSMFLPRREDGYVPSDQEAGRVEIACTQEVIDSIDTILAPGVYDFVEDCRETTYEQMEKFGYFRTERYRYDRRLGGGHDDNREFYANVHDMWQNGRTRNADGAWVTTPADELRPKPIVYYLNVDFPRDLEHIAGQMANDWDAGFSVAAAAKMGLGADEAGVATLRERLEADTDGKGWMFLEGDAFKQGGMFQIRRNTCSIEGIEDWLADKKGAYDDVIEEATKGAGILPGNIKRVCSGLTHFSRLNKEAVPFTWQQVGDLRFNIINWVVDPQPSGPLGYGPSAADPETGRIIAGSAHVYGASVDTYARSAADIVRAMNEDLDINALISGRSYEQWIESGKTVADLEFNLTARDFERLDLRAGTNFDPKAAYGEFRMPNGRIDGAAALAHFEERFKNPRRDDPIADVINGPVDEGRARLDALKQDPEMRARLIQPEMLSLLRPLHGLRPTDPVTAELEDDALNLVYDPQTFHAEQEAWHKLMRDNNVYMAEFADDSIIGLAMEMKGLDADEVYKVLREGIFRGVMLHEIGHTIGLRHNFEGSFDALNYHDEYWAIRDREADEHEHNRLRLPEYRYASIMDYGARFNSDFHGLGKYDLAAVKFAYGGLIETFADDVEVPAGLSTEVWIEGTHLIPELLGGFENIRRRKDVSAKDRHAERIEGAIENARLMMENPARPITDYWRDNEVPYGFCSDEYNGSWSCRVWDEGPSHTDVVESAIRNYWNYYHFTAYRRGRSEVGFINGFFGRQNRLARYITYPFRYFFYYQDYNIGVRNDLYQAALVGMNFINQVLGTPLPGKHCLDPDRNIYVPVEHVSAGEARDCEALIVPVGTGRQETNTITDEYDYRFDYIGSYYDKVNFLTFLMDTSSQFIRVTNVGDLRTFSIGYYRVFREELLKLVRDTMFAWADGELNEAVSGLVAADGPADARIIPRVLADREAFNQGEDEMAGMARLYAPTSYNIVWQSLVLSTIFNTSAYDEQLDFAEYLAISEVGSGDDRTYPEDWDVVTFAHPVSGIQYRAAQTSDGKSLSYELLERANTFVTDTWRVAEEALARAPFDAQARADMEAANLRLEQYVDLMSDLRLLRNAVDLADD